ADDGSTASTHLEALSHLAPESAPVWNRLELTREQLEQSEQTADAYRRATQLDPLDPDPWINLERLLQTARQHEEAHDAFDVAVARAKAHNDTHLGRNLARATTDDLASAIADFERAAKLLPNDAEPLLARDDLLHDLDQVEKSVQV